MGDDVVINVSDLWKRYGLPLGQIIPPFLRKTSASQASAGRKHWALGDINLEVEGGETLGIIGFNGAGKSTLLKVLAGVTPPTRGEIQVEGRVFPMIELNAGLNKELTGRQNVFVLGAIMGLPRREIRKRIPDIEEFCELGNFFDEPVRKYSSGMLARLGFGVAVNVSADILLIDEVLAVGDLSFQRKCFDHIEHMRRSGNTILFVSHNLRQIDRLCDRVVLLHEGRVARMGRASEIAHHFYQLSQEVIFSRFQEKRGRMFSIPESSGDIEVIEVKILDGQDRESDQVSMFDAMTIRLEFRAEKPVEAPIFQFGILTTDMIEATNVRSENAKDRLTYHGHCTIDCVIPNVQLYPGPYSIRYRIVGRDGRLYARAEHVATFRVVSDAFDVIRDGKGIFHAPVEWLL